MRKARSIICVDDEPVILEALKDLLKPFFSHKCTIHTVRSAEEAIALFRQLRERGEEIPVMVADYLMSGMKGDDLIIKIKELSPHTLNILVTAEVEGIAVGNLINHGAIFRYVQKPWKDDVILQFIKEAYTYFCRKNSKRRIEKAIAEISMLIHLPEQLESVLSFLVQETGATGGYIFLKEQGTSGFHIYTCSKHKKRFLSPVMQEIISVIKSSREPVMVQTEELCRWLYKKSGTEETKLRPLMALPLLHNQELSGIAYLEKEDFTVPFLEDQMNKALKFVSGIVVAIENARLYEIKQRAEISLLKHQKKLELNVKEMKKITAGIIDALSLTVEMRDPFTGGHQHRVAKLVTAIAMELNMVEEEVEAVMIAGLIHDIGKIIVPIEILSKPGKLDEDEFSIIMDHPLSGYEILKGIPFKWSVAEAVKQHHERLDGSGYPYGLKGNEISLVGRIVAVADVVEAIMSHRPYRPAFPPYVALQEINRNKGVKYDARVVDICTRLLTENNFKFD